MMPMEKNREPTLSASPALDYHIDISKSPTYYMQRITEWDSENDTALFRYCGLFNLIHTKVLHSANISLVNLLFYAR